MRVFQSYDLYWNVLQYIIEIKKTTNSFFFSFFNTKTHDFFSKPIAFLLKLQNLAFSTIFRQQKLQTSFDLLL